MLCLGYMKLKEAQHLAKREHGKDSQGLAGRHNKKTALSIDGIFESQRLAEAALRRYSSWERWCLDETALRKGGVYDIWCFRICCA